MHQILPILSRRVILRCQRATTIGLFPERSLASLLLAADAQHKDFADSVSLEVPRSGRIRYEPGERFEFALHASAAHADRLSRIETLLRGLPGSAPRHDDDVAFGDNWSLDSIEALCPTRGIDAQTLETEAAHLRENVRIRMRLVSPVRIALRRSSKAKGRLRYARGEQDLTDEALSHALTQSLVALKFCCGASDWTPPDIRLRIVRRELFFVAPAKTSAPSRKPLDEGLMGEIIVEPAGQDAADLLWHLALLQYFGIGQGRAFGLGRFQLETLAGDCRKLRPSAVQDLLQRAAEERNLTLAWRHVGLADDLREWPGPVASGDDADEVQQQSTEQYNAWLDRLADTVAAGNHSPAPLRPVDIAKPDGGVRRLQIPGFRDRVAQRAVLQVIEPALDVLFSEAAYGFRRGRGREQARDRLLMHERAGDHYIGETDIRAFFDAVAWWRVETRLRCLFGDDPAVNQIMRWLETPCLEGEPRTQGLPQGAPLSPILSNLMLDHFDRVLTGAGHKLVRFADDLVIVGKARSEVEAGLSLAAQVLADCGLTLKLDKTRIATFKEGFRFLGYQFVGGLAVPTRRNSLAVAVDERKPQGTDDDAADAAATARLGATLSEQLTPPPECAHEPDRVAFSGEEPGTLLVINEPKCRLSLKDGSLQVTRADDSTALYPFSSLGSVLLASRAHLSTEVIKASMRAGVPLHFLSDGGAWIGSTAGEPDSGTLALWQTQQQRFSEPGIVLAGARVLVQARIASMHTLLKHRRARIDNIERLQALHDACANASSVDALRGLEGQATHVHFRAIAHLLPPQFPFEQRNRRPPRDPVNALLSFGYTLLYQAAQAVLTAERLNPRLGLYHRPHGTHSALASDCIEPFRFLVERQMLSMLNRRELKPEDFEIKGNGACLLRPQPRRAFVLRMHQRFQQPLRAIGDEQARGVYGHLQLQAIALRGMIGGGALWAPPRFR